MHGMYAKTSVAIERSKNVVWICAVDDDILQERTKERDKMKRETRQGNAMQCNAREGKRGLGRDEMRGWGVLARWQIVESVSFQHGGNRVKHQVLTGWKKSSPSPPTMNEIHDP